MELAPRASLPRRSRYAAFTPTERLFAVFSFDEILQAADVRSCDPTGDRFISRTSEYRGATRLSGAERNSVDFSR